MISVDTCLPMAKKLAREAARKANALDELDEFRAVANHGLAYAYSRFKDDKGMKFSTYAYLCINTFLTDYLRKRVRKGFTSVAPRTKDRIAPIHIVSLNAPLPGLEKGRSFDPPDDREERYAKQRDARLDIDELFKVLNAKQAATLRGFFVDNKSAEQIAKEIGVNRNIVFVLKETALRRIRECLSM